MARLSFPAVLGRRQRLLTGILGIGVGFGGPFLLSVAMVATSGDPSLLMLPLPFLGALWLMQGLAPQAYTLEADGIRLERRWRSRLLPYTAILGHDRAPRTLGGIGAIGLNGLFGSHGWRWNPRTGWHYLAIANTSELVWLRTTAGLVVISPSRPEEFIARLRARLSALSPRSTAARAPAARGPASAARAEESDT